MWNLLIGDLEIEDWVIILHVSQITKYIECILYV